MTSHWWMSVAAGATAASQVTDGGRVDSRFVLRWQRDVLLGETSSKRPPEVEQLEVFSFLSRKKGGEEDSRRMFVQMDCRETNGKGNPFFLFRISFNVPNVTRNGKNKLASLTFQYPRASATFFHAAFDCWRYRIKLSIKRIESLRIDYIQAHQIWFPAVILRFDA